MSLKKVLICLTLVAVVAALAVVSGCNVVTGSGKDITLDYDYTDFNMIEAGYAFDVEVTRADSYLVRITIDEALQDYLRVEKSGNTLKITMKPNYAYTNFTHKAVITLPDLYRIDLSGASDGILSGFSSSHEMDFELSGASEIDLSNMKAGDTEFELSGASKVAGSMDMDDARFDLSGASSLRLAGSAEDIVISASGASDVTLGNVPAVNARVELSGASDAEINISGQLDVNLSGASDLKYAGNPRLGSIDISGGSKISQR